MTIQRGLDRILLTRRQALGALGAAAACASAPGWLLTGCAPSRGRADGAADVVPTLSVEIAHQLAQAAVESARKRGASYADARVVSIRTQQLWAEDRRIGWAADTESRGLGVRVIVDGAWGFAASSALTLGDAEAIAQSAVEVARASAVLSKGQRVRLAAEPAHRDSYRSPRQVDPFGVPLDRKAALLLKANAAMLGVKEVRKAQAWLEFEAVRKTFASSDGSLIDLDLLNGICGLEATAVAGGDAKTRSYEPPPLQAGFEQVTDAGLVEQAGRVGEEAVAKLHAPSVQSGEFDLVLLPNHLALTIHESVGHATELDRALGMEESLSGGSFATPAGLGKLRYGSDRINFKALDQQPRLLASVGYDDDGVGCQDWDIVRDGILVGFTSSREVAPAIGDARSRGSCRADSWASIPIVRQPNLCLVAGRERLSFDDLLADTKRGILIDGTGSYSIDNKRLNFQFGGDAFWEIRDGKRAGMLRDVTYTAITPQFWGSCDAICDEREWRPNGVWGCGKGDPMQISKMSHGSAPARFRKVAVRRAE